MLKIYNPIIATKDGRAQNIMSQMQCPIQYALREDPDTII